MKLTHTRDELLEALGGVRPVGLVPTMGALHEGHASLVARARSENAAVVVSVFVNPLQFGPGEDLSRYPRTLERDVELAAAAGADVVFAPGVDTMYPSGFATRVEVGGPAEVLEGASRPGHFSGVATVVLKLLNLTSPDRAYFGEKDWQQLAVVRRLVQDLNVTTEIVGCPTVREPSGLARSSRNAYLSDEDRARAVVLYRALTRVQKAYANGERLAKRLLDAGRVALMAEPDLSLDYLTLVDADLRPVEVVRDAASARLLIAARLAGVRLIDNVPLVPDPVPPPPRLKVVSNRGASSRSPNTKAPNLKGGPS